MLPELPPIPVIYPVPAPLPTCIEHEVTKIDSNGTLIKTKIYINAPCFPAPVNQQQEQPKPKVPHRGGGRDR